MALIKEESNKTNVTRCYSISRVQTIDATVEWLSDVRKIPSVSTDHIYFADLTNRFDEGNESVQLDANASLNDMRQCFRENSIDMILLDGEYNGHLVVIGVDPYKKQVRITIEKKILRISYFVPKGRLNVLSTHVLHYPAYIILKLFNLLIFRGCAMQIIGNN